MTEGSSLIDTFKSNFRLFKHRTRVYLGLEKKDWAWGTDYAGLSMWYANKKIVETKDENGTVTGTKEVTELSLKEKYKEKYDFVE